MKIMKNLRIQIENQENHENHRIPFENNEKHASLEFQTRIMTIMKIL